MARVPAKKRTSTRRTRATQKPVAKKPRQAAQAPASTAAPTPARSRWRRVPKSERPVRPKLPNVLRLSKATYRLLALNWKLVVGIGLVYALLNILLVRGINGGTNVSQLKTQFDQAFSGGWGHVASGLSVFALLFSSTNSSSSATSVSGYQTFLLLGTSLALVWSYRQLLSDSPLQIRVRDAFYKGMYPLIPVMLVLAIMALQVIPLAIGGALFGIVMTSGIATNIFEVGIWFVIFMATLIISLRMLIASIFALYIVSLPDMTPLRAIRSARELVRYRRLAVLVKLLFLPICLFVLLGAIMLPLILFVTPLAQWVFLILSVAILPITHAYLYTLYRELLNE